MFSGMTSAQTLGEVCVIVFIVAAVLGTLAVVGAARYALVAAPSERSFVEWMNAALAADEPAPPAPAYREPADLDEVDARARWFARATVDPFTAPAALPAAPAPDATTALPVGINSSRTIRQAEHATATSVNPTSPYYRPSVAAFVARPAPVFTYHGAHADSVGRHRRPEPALAAA